MKIYSIIPNVFTAAQKGCPLNVENEISLQANSDVQVRPFQLFPRVETLCLHQDSHPAPAPAGVKLVGEGRNAPPSRPGRGSRETVAAISPPARGTGGARKPPARRGPGPRAPDAAEAPLAWLVPT